MASGKVALCCMDGEGKHVIGDVRTQSVLEIYNSPGYRKMRQFTFSRKAAAAPCDTCVILDTRAFVGELTFCLSRIFFSKPASTFRIML